MRIPTYRKVKDRDQACSVWQRKKRYWPGPYNSNQSREAYRVWLRDVVMAGVPARFLEDEGPLRVVHLVERWLDHARDYYGPESSEYSNMKDTTIPFAKSMGAIPAAEFGPKKLKEWIAQLIDRNHCRTYINAQRGKLLRMFRWAAEEELIPGTVPAGLECVKSLLAGRTDAREPAAKIPVRWEWVEAACCHLAPHLRDMLLIQWYTLVRSDSLVNASGGQFDRQTLVWRPKHKTQSRGKVLMVPIGPRAWALLEPYLNRAACDDPLFPVSMAGHHPRFNTRYSTDTYRQAIENGAEKANVERISWELDPFPHWTPHAIRNGRGQEIRERFGAEAAQAMLGHDSLTATQIYTSKRLQLAKEIAQELG